MATNLPRGGDGLGAMDGARLFVAGGSSGMGAAIALMAAARGAQVAIAGRCTQKLDRVADLLGDQCLGRYALDIGNAEAVKSALKEHGPYDFIVCSAADLTFKPFVQLEDREIETMISSKLMGPINLARAAAEHLSPAGSVLFFSGVAAYRQTEGTSLVGSINMALESLVANLAIEMKPKRFNVICPGVVDSATWDKACAPVEAANIPAGRRGQAQDIAHAALAILENNFINASVVNVDGGARVS
ncbi:MULTISPECIES: SDR family oxidoreductase [unclassified Halomonas]|uniref:SDR family oxidoreductase n=1 Tax=unclassified Halomonas TaxID=2609666 RepID=UPI002076ABE2|nr:MULTISPECIES: SDR family oxidoreductase [unclassified Halomonas]